MAWFCICFNLITSTVLQCCVLDLSCFCCSTSDCGAIYSSVDWAAFGNVIRFNYIHNIATIMAGVIDALYYVDVKCRYSPPL